MDQTQMHILPDNRQVICTTNYNPAHQRIIRASGANFSRAYEPAEMQYYTERPMMLDTWTQTSNADLGVSDDYLMNVYMEQQRQREKALLEKISVLKAELRAHSDMLSQIQSTNAHRGTTTIQKQQHRQQQQPAAVANPQMMQQHDQQNHQQRQKHENTSPQMQLYHAQSSSRNVQECEEVILPHDPQERPEQQKLGHNNTSPQCSKEMNGGAESTTQQKKCVSQNTHTIINTTQEVRPRNVNYTIIADGDPNCHDGPIEIEIAEEENALNLNCSADSERLEICLSEEQPSEANVSYVKYEVDNEQSSAEDKLQNQQKNRHPSSVSPIASKRLKMSPENLTQYSDQQIFEVRELSQESSAEYPAPQSYETPESRPLLPLPTNRNNASLLKLPVDTHQRNGEQNEPLKGKQEPKVFYCSIGPNNTRIPTKVFDGISWASASIATRKLMMAVFDRETLATHSMTGKPSPAFKDHNKPLKKMLNPLAIQDIIFAVTRRCKVSEKEVRNAITTKCADENKMWKLAQAKKISLCEQDKENVA